MKERNHTIITISTFCGMLLMVLALLGFVWNASAKNSKLETVYDEQKTMKIVDASLITTTALHTTAIAVMQKDLTYIVDSIDDLKRINGLSVRRRIADPNR